MWELDQKESWVLKNWCFSTVVLEKTLESPLDCKIKSANSKGNQSWILIGRTDVEVETPILWPPDEKCLIWKDPDAGKVWGQEEKGWQRIRWLNGITDSMDMSLSKLRDNEGQGSLACCSPWGHKESDSTYRLNSYKPPICNMSSSFFTSSLAPCVTYVAPPLGGGGMVFSKILDSNFLMTSKIEHLVFV